MTQQTASRHRAAGRTRVLGRPSLRLLGAALTVLVVVMVTAGTTWFSGASFTAGSNTLARVGAASDYHPPRVSVTSPGATVQGAVQVQAVASDTGSGVNRVVIEYAAAGSVTWTPLCTDTISPYACAWDTTKVSDGDFRLRATATDNVGTATTSTVVTTRVANPATVELATIADVVRGTVPLSATVTGAGTRTATSTFQRKLSDATNWTSISGCADVTGTSPTCSWSTSGLTSSDYDVQVVTTLTSPGASLVISDVQEEVTVDYTAPTVSVTAPEPMRGTVQVTATPADEHSAIARVELSYKTAVLGTYTPLCTVTAEPYRCALNTTTLANTNYDLRAIAYDVVGNVSAAATARRAVDNGSATITVTAPLSGEVVRGSTTITTEHSVPFGGRMTSVQVDARLAGTSTWSVVCPASTATSCEWSTSTLPSGIYELRARLTYVTLLGRTQTTDSELVSVTVDNTPLKALDVQASSGSNAGKPSAGDTLVLTYEGSLDLGTVKSGWNGTETTINVTFRDMGVNPATTGDRATFDVPLGAVVFSHDYVKSGKSVAMTARMTATTIAVGGKTLTEITVTLDGSSSRELRTGKGNGTMRWTPSATVRTPGGVACSTTTAVESGAADREF